LEQDLAIDLTELQGHLDGMLDRVQHNSLTLKRLQAFEMRLIGLNSLAEIIDFILSETKALFELDTISLCLIDRKEIIAAYLAHARYPYQSRGDLFLIKDPQFLKNHTVIAGRPLLGSYQSADCEHFFTGSPQPASVMLAPILRRGKCMGSLNLGSYREDRFIHSMGTDFVEHLASVIAVCLENALNFETLRRTTLVDPLTGVNNRRYLEQRIEEELSRSQRSHQPLSCLFLDIDFFKHINDGHGHPAGDHVLTQVAADIKKQLRSNDVLARYGGEEFVALLSPSDEQKAGEIAERIRASIQALTIEFAERVIPVTVSIGTSTFQPDSAIKSVEGVVAEHLIQSADAALYQAKRNGRNRVENSGVLVV